MSFDFSVLLPILAMVVSIGAAVFWDGGNGKAARVERYISEAVLQEKRGPQQAYSAKLVRVEIEPGNRLKSSDLRARDEREGTMSTLG